MGAIKHALRYLASAPLPPSGHTADTTATKADTTAMTADAA